MHHQTLPATFGGLLHDVGKIAFRSGGSNAVAACLSEYARAEQITDFQTEFFRKEKSF